MILSIITVNLNNKDGLIKTIESVAAQTWRDFEYIIIDGASDDGSVEQIRQFENQNAQSANPIPYKWVSEHDKGIYNAMNKGTKIAKGDYCLFLNSGDCLYESSTLAKVFSQSRNYDIFWGKMLYCPSDGNSYINRTDNLQVSPFRQFTLSIPHQSCFFKRTVLLDENLYDENLRIASDHKFLYKAIFVDKRPSSFIDVLVSIMDGNGISSNLSACRKEDDIIFCEFFSPSLLDDYHDWLKMQELISKKDKYIQSYRNAIAVYDAIKKRTLLRKIHTIVYKWICKYAQ